MSFFDKIYWWFSPYTDEPERKVGRFFMLLSYFNNREIKQRLKKLMQSDLIRLNLYQEHKFKGYKNLSKNQRKKLYTNANTLQQSFLRFYETNQTAFVVPAPLKKIDVPEEKKIFLVALLEFLSPHRNFEYRESAAFSRLLRNPNNEKLVGDCNQICTLYLALYSLKFPIDDFKIKILPNHVCLHYQGIDLEATNGTLKNYRSGETLPVTEMVSTNMLDVSDKSQKQQTIDPKTFATGAKLVFLISSSRTLAEKNLRIAYHNLGVQFLKQDKFDIAAVYFRDAKEPKQVEVVWQSAVKYWLDRKKFKRALKYAKKSKDKKIRELVLQNHGVFLLNKKKYREAEKKFVKIGDTKSQKIVWQNELYELNKKLKRCKTIEDFRGKKSTLKQMKKLAYKLDNLKVKQFCDDILKKL